MSTSPEARNTTVEIQLSEEEKQTLETAAATRSLSLSEYLREMALIAAKEEITQPQSGLLSEGEWEVFLSLLEGSSEINETNF